MGCKRGCKTTSSRVGRISSSILRDDRYSAKAKSAAGSALSQRTSKKK